MSKQNKRWYLKVTVQRKQTGCWREEQKGPHFAYLLKDEEGKVGVRPL